MDDLSQDIVERQKRNPRFREMIAAEEQRLILIMRLVAMRKRNKLTQAVVADRMGVSQSVVAEIESGEVDVRHSTLERYTNAVSNGKASVVVGVAEREPALVR